MTALHNNISANMPLDIRDIEQYWLMKVFTTPTTDNSCSYIKLDFL